MAAKESTPLLGSSSAAQNEASPLLAATAPPPVDAPPPLPNNDEEAPIKTNNKGGKSRHKKQYSSTSIDNSSEDVSQTQAKKKRSGKKKRGDALSSTSTTNKRSLNNNKAKKKKKNDDGPKKTPLHVLFDILRYLAIISSAAIFFTQLLPIVWLRNEKIITGLQYFVRIYLMIFCVSFVLLESRIPLLRRLTFPAHDNWILRGFMYTFIGIIGMEQDVAIKVEEIASGSHLLGPDYGSLLASLSISVTTWIMVGVGVLYMILGMMCLQNLYERMETDYNSKLNEWKNKKSREREFQKEKEAYVKYEKDRKEGRGEWYDDIETGG